MGLFSEIFKQLVYRKEKNKKKHASFDSNNTIEAKKSLLKNKIFSKNVESGWAVIGPNRSPQKKLVISRSVLSSLLQKTSSTIEGKGFKYNEDGRRYHGNEEIAYMLPNDDDETDRLHEQHWILRYLLQCNYRAPVTKMLEDGIEVLDSGCGPATWTFEMANTFPMSKFYGIDVSSVFPEAIRPGNVDLTIANIAKSIPFPDNKFDYIHQRLLMAGLTSDDWDRTLQELYRVLKPGGYIELAEFSSEYFPSTLPHWVKLQKVTMGVFSSLSIPPRITTELLDRLLKTGFVNEKLEVIPLPVNHDGKRGELMWKDLEDAFMSLRPAVAKICPEWEDAKVYENFLAGCGSEAKKNEFNFDWHVYYAQKPFE